jgi:hypothetical protein
MANPFISTFNQGQQNLFNRQAQGYGQGPQSLNQSPLYNSGLQYLMQILGGGEEGFKNFEAPFMRQFNEQTIPGIAERFAGAGAQSSSAFQQALGQAGAGLSENLAALRSGLQMQALPTALQYAQQPFENQNQLLGMNTQAEAPQSFLQKLLISLASGAGNAATRYATGGF